MSWFSHLSWSHAALVLVLIWLALICWAIWGMQNSRKPRREILRGNRYKPQYDHRNLVDKWRKGEKP